MSQLDSAVIKTLAYFDIFQYPLTSSELHRYCWWPHQETPPPLAMIDDYLHQTHSGIATAEGFYFLAARSADIVTQRKQRFVAAEAKFRKAQRVGQWLATVPFVRGLLVSNTVSYGNPAPDSDIDIVVITAPGATWVARAGCLLFLKLFDLRPRAGKKADQICLSFFVDTDHLSLEVTALPRTDIHFYYWIDQLVPIYDAGGVYAAFRQANQWIKQWLPHALIDAGHQRRMIRVSVVRRVGQRIGEILCGRWCWPLIEQASRRRLPQPITEKINRHPGVIIKPGILKLIGNDRREGYRNEWVTKVNQLLQADE